MNFLFRQRNISDVSCQFLHRALQNQNLWYTYSNSQYKLYFYPDPNKDRMNHFLTTEVQRSSQDLVKEARKCMIFSSFYYIFFILSQIPEQPALPFTCSQTLPCFPVLKEHILEYHKSCAAGHDKFTRMPETQISVCVWSPCVLTWELKSYWLWFSQDK